jgi:hypothetical protein
MPIEQFERHIKLPPRGVQRERAKEAGNRVGNSGGICDRLRHLPFATEDLCRKREQRRGCLACIGFEIGEPRHRVVVEIEATGVEQSRQRRRREPMAFDHREKRGRHRVGGCLFGPSAVDHFAPPLQADFAGQRLARHLAHARHLDVEGIERVQRRAIFRRREQGTEKTVAIGGPDQLGAIGEGILHDDELIITRSR